MVAIPLGIFVVVMLLNLRDIPQDEPKIPSHESAEPLTIEPTPQSVQEATTADALAVAPIADPSTIKDEPIAPEVVLAHELLSTQEPTIETLAAKPESEAVAVASGPELIDSDEPAPVAIAAETEPIATGESATVAKAPTSPAQPPEIKALDPEEPEPILPEGPVVLPPKGSPKYAFDYRGRLWIEKKNKGFFRQLRRPQIPPEDPQSNSSR